MRITNWNRLYRSDRRRFHIGWFGDADDNHLFDLECGVNVTAPEKIVLSWSGGKDSALALYELRKIKHLEIVSLLTTISREYERISHHGVRTELLERQAVAVGVPLRKLYLPSTDPGPCTNKEYEAAMKSVMMEYVDAGVTTVAFGDIFLEDLREYREGKLPTLGMKALFPIWKRDTSELVQTFIDLGFRAYLSCVDAQKLGKAFAGRAIDESLVRDLPHGVDPCGENGEFHSYVYDGPIFGHSVNVKVGAIVPRDTRYFADLTLGLCSEEDTASTAHVSPISLSAE